MTEYASKAQEQVAERIRPWMQEMFGNLLQGVQDHCATLHVRVGSARTETTVTPWGEDDATITTRACVAAGSRIDEALLRRLLQINHDVRFGAFSLDEHGDIFYSHSIVGSTCDREELRSSVTSVVLVADRYDDEIVRRWGGKRALEQPLP